MKKNLTQRRYPYVTYCFTMRRIVIINRRNCTTYSLPKILHTNDNSRGAQTLTSSLLICNWNFVSYSTDGCIFLLSMKDCFQFMNNFGNWCLLAAFHIYVTLLWNCVQRLVVRTCVKQLFTALHCMQCGLAIVKPSVPLSVRSSVKRVHCDKTKAPSEKSSIMTRKSTTSFPMSIRLTANVALQAPMGVSKCKVTVFRIQKWAFLEESLPQSFFVWKLQRQSCKAFTGLDSVHKWLVGDVPSTLPEMLGQSEPSL